MAIKKTTTKPVTKPKSIKSKSGRTAAKSKITPKIKSSKLITDKISKPLDIKNNDSSEKSKKNTISKRRSLLVLLVLTGMLLGVFSLKYYYDNVYLSYSRVFWGAIDQQLDLRSITKKVDNSSEGTKRTSSTYLNLSNKQYSLTTGKTEVEATKKSFDLSQYSGVASDYANITAVDLAGQSGDVSEFVGKWSNINPTENEQKLAGTNLRNNQLLSEAFPIAKLDQPTRSKLVNDLKSKSVYRYDTKYVLKRKVGNKNVFVYNIELDANAYFGVMKDYIKAAGLKELSIDELDEINAGRFGKANLYVAIDPKSRYILQTGLGDFDAQPTTKTDFVNHNLIRDIAQPEASIPIKSISDGLKNAMTGQN
jgi:hypothetical protein